MSGPDCKLTTPLQDPLLNLDEAKLRNYVSLLAKLFKPIVFWACTYACVGVRAQESKLGSHRLASSNQALNFNNSRKNIYRQFHFDGGVKNASKCHQSVS